MWQRLYVQHLKHDIEIWIERGWVTPQNADAILSSQESGNIARRFPQLLALLGAVLIGFAAMSFVAANWNEIPRLLKLILLIGAMWAAYGAAIMLEQRNHPAYAQAAIVAGLALFGADIVLVAQIYHITSESPTWLLVWALAALATAWALSSRPALVMAFLLASIWAGWNFTEGPIEWGFLVVWAAALALVFRLSWLPGFHLALLTLAAWFALNGGEMARLVGDESLISFYLLLSLLGWLAATLLKPQFRRFSSVGENYAIAFVLLLAFLLQLTVDGIRHPGGIVDMTYPHLLNVALLLVILALVFIKPGKASRLDARDIAGFAGLAVFAALHPWLASVFSFIDWIDGAVFFALSAWLIAYGAREGNRFALNAGFVAFGAEALYIYFETLGSLLDTAVFFALGGILLIAGSFLLARLRRQVVDAASHEGTPK